MHIVRFINRRGSDASRAAAAEARATRRSLEEDVEFNVDDEELLPLFRDSASPKVVDAMRDFYGHADLDHWLTNAKERDMIIEHGDGSITLTAMGRSSMKLQPSSITVGLPARKRRPRRSK